MNPWEVILSIQRLCRDQSLHPKEIVDKVHALSASVHQPERVWVQELASDEHVSLNIDYALGGQIKISTVAVEGQEPYSKFIVSMVKMSERSTAIVIAHEE